MTGSIYTRRNIRVLGGFVVLAALILAYVMYKPAIATHTPADKAYASGANTEPIEAGTGEIILTAKMRTSKPTDLMFHVTLECAILTKLLTTNPTTGTSAANTASTAANIQVWIEQVGRGIVPIKSSSEPPQNGSTPNSGDDTDKVTFCHREEGRQVTNSEAGANEIDTEQTYQDTKTANAFNWVLLNAGSGVYTYNVKASITEAGGNTCTKDFAAQTCSNAFIGNRTLLIVPTKMANDISI